MMTNMESTVSGVGEASKYQPETTANRFGSERSGMDASVPSYSKRVSSVQPSQRAGYSSYKPVA